ncbi:transmembrane protein 116 [Cololabis saira]|uniref:transmembrane protein 116 n=1 Tax=Cololabis saira TaxID=129043 RepID=UPI002AD3E2B2|nr:transmembrane protein 116 [Cololabis saira]
MNPSSFSNSSERNETGALDWTQVYEAVSWIQLVMGVLSIVGSGSIIVCLLLQRRCCRKPELQPLFLLSVSDLLLSVSWTIGAVLFSRRCSRTGPCYNLHALEQVLYMASFFYTLNYVWNLYKATREKFYSCSTGYSVQFSNRVSTAAKVTALLSCLLPVLLMTPVFIQGNVSHCQANLSQPYRCLLMLTGALYRTTEPQQLSRTCSFLHTYHILVFLGSFLLTLVGITVLVLKARCIYRRAVASSGYLGNEQRAVFRLMDRRMILYPLVFLLCWGPAVTLAFLRVAAPAAGHGGLGVVLYISQAFTSASQGFLNCLVFGWTRAGLRRAGRTALRRDVDTQTPLLRNQQVGGYRALRTLT